MPLVYVARYMFASTGRAGNYWFWVELLGTIIFAALSVLGVKRSELDIHPRLVRNCLPGGGPRLRSVCGGACSRISESIAH
jgi:hypothetical protein